jgi:hypothetical protein
LAPKAEWGGVKMNSKKVLLTLSVLLLLSVMLVSCGTPPEGLPSLGAELYVISEDGSMAPVGEIVTVEDLVEGAITPLYSDRAGYGLVLLNSRVQPGVRPPARYYKLPEPTSAVVASEVSENAEVGESSAASHGPTEVFKLQERQSDINPFDSILPWAGWGWFVLVAFVLVNGVFGAIFISREQKPLNLTTKAEARTSDGVAVDVHIGTKLIRVPTLGALLKRFNYRDVGDLEDVIEETIRGSVFKWVSRKEHRSITSLPSDEDFIVELTRLVMVRVEETTGFRLDMLWVTQIGDPSNLLDAASIGGIAAQVVRNLQQEGSNLSAEGAAKLYGSLRRSDAIKGLSGDRGVIATFGLDEGFRPEEV